MADSLHQRQPLRPHPETVIRRVGGGAVLVNLWTGHVFELNETAARVWELLVGGVSRSELVRALLEEYDGDAAAVGRDVDELLALLSERGLLES